ncbi:MAG: hypothetical protein LUD27_05095 [Clostridia bacterium]|nr:hypothetical protein [Clostridia bacterium]
MRAAKTFLIFIAAMASALLIVLLPQRLAFDEGESYTFFCGDTSADCRIITVDKNASLYKLALKDVCGESTLYPSLDVQSFLQKVNGEIIFTEELSDSVNYYCKADLEYSVALYGEQINLHICVKQQGVTVASPIIFGGY